MVLGVLVPGMAAGAIVAAVWLASGGSLLVAVLLYACAGTFASLGLSALVFLLSEARRARLGDDAGALRPAD